MASPSESQSSPPGEEGGKLQIKIPIIPALVSYECELRPDSFVAKLWGRSSRLARSALVGGLLLLVLLVGLGGWRLLRDRFRAPGPSSAGHEVITAHPPPTGGGEAVGPTAKPPLYAVRVVVLGPDDRPVEDSTIRVSAGNEPQRVPGGWEVEIPRAKVPEDGKVTLWAEDPGSSGRGSQDLVLGDDPTPGVRIRLTVPEAKVRGTVFGPGDRALADAVVSISGHGEDAVVTGARGAFELLAHRPPGQQVRLHVEHPEYPSKDQFCWAGATDCEIRLDKH